MGVKILHPGRLTWNLQITHLERKMIFQTSVIMFHVNLQGCNLYRKSVYFPTSETPNHIFYPPLKLLEKKDFVSGISIAAFQSLHLDTHPSDSIYVGQKTLLCLCFPGAAPAKTPARDLHSSLFLFDSSWTCSFQTSGRFAHGMMYSTKRCLPRLFWVVGMEFPPTGLGSFIRQRSGKRIRPPKK